MNAVAQQHIDKLPPQNIEAEMATLGAMLIDEQVIAEVLEIIGEAAYYKEEHRLIFSSITALFDDRKKVDILTVSDDLEKKKILDRVGGAAYLTQLTDFVPTSANAAHYARIVREKGIKRALITSAHQIATSVYKEEDDVGTLLDNAEKLIFDISNQRIASSYIHIRDIIKDGIELIESLYHKKSHVTGIATGYADFDQRTAGMQAGDLIIIAGRPSMGKSAFATSILENIAVDAKIPVAIFSLEMSKAQVMQRFLCSQAKIDAHKVRTGFLAPSEWPLLTGAAGRLAESEIYIDDTPSISIFELRAKARRLKAHHNVQVVAVDYLQLMRGGLRRSESRQQEISEISQSLKALAKELRVPVIAISQLSRAVEGREGHRPQLSDLRESGAIEQDADVVVLLYRPEYYNPTEENRGLAEVIIAKQRNGPVGTVEMTFLREYMKFADKARTN